MKTNCKTLAIIAAALLASITLSVDAKASANLEYGANSTKIFTTNDFSQIEILGKCDATIEHSKIPSVKVMATDKDPLDYIKVDNNLGKLMISTETPPYKNIFKFLSSLGKSKNKIKIHINSQSPIRSIKTSGAVKLNYKEISSNIFTIETSGASKVYLSGKTDILKIVSSGASKINAKNLQSLASSVNTSGASQVTVYAKKRLKINASGASNIKYYGNPKQVGQQTSVSVIIKKMD